LRLLKKLKLSIKISISVIIVSLLCLSFALVAVNTYFSSAVGRYARENFEKENALMANYINEWLNHLISILDTKYIIASNLSSDIFAEMTIVLQQENEAIVLSILGFEETGTAISSAVEGLPPDWELFTRPWFVIAMENPGEINVQSPFWSVVAHIWITSISRSITYADGTSGAIALNISLDAIFDMMDGFAIEGGGYVFLMDSYGVAISHPNKAYSPHYAPVNLHYSQTYSAVLPDALATGYFVPFVTTDGVPAYIIARELDTSGWMLVSVVYESNIYAMSGRLTTTVMLKIIVVMAVFTILILICVSKLIRSGVADSIKQFRASSASLARGEDIKLVSNKDDSFGLGEIRDEFDQNLKILKNIMDDLAKFSQEIIENGVMDYRIDSDKYSDSYRELIQNINSFADKFFRQSEKLKITEENNQAKSKFLATMSHEIRTPITSVLGISEIHLQNPNLTLEIEEAFSKIYSSGTILLNIVNDILDLSKIEAGKMEIINDKYEVASLIGDTAVLTLVYLGSKRLEFLIDADENMPSYLIGDELRIKQILNNLLSNAVKYTEEGSVSLSVYSESTDNSNAMNLIISITDTGRGMTPEQMNTLFDEYTRFHEKDLRYTSGTGLGMAIAHNLLTMMDASIEVKSEVGKGTCVIVKIPQGIANIEPLGAETVNNLKNFNTETHAAANRLSFDPVPMPYGRVLVVDDIETNLYVAKGLLSRLYQIQVDTVSSGKEAIKKIEGGEVYHIVFMDQMMPEMDGSEAVAIMRQMGYDQPIVALTANALVGQAEKLMSLGFDGFLSKPIQTVHLNTIVNKYVKDRHTEHVTLAADSDNNNSSHGNRQNEVAVQDGRIGIDPYLQKIFCKDATHAIDAMREALVTKDIKRILSMAHAMKSALANVGESETSIQAQTLEQACAGSDFGFISAQCKGFIEALEGILSNYCKLDLAITSTSEVDISAIEDTAFLQEQLQKIKLACEQYNANQVYALMNQLNEKQWTKDTTLALAAIRDIIYLESDFEAAVDKCVELLAKESKDICPTD